MLRQEALHDKCSTHITPMLLTSSILRNRCWNLIAVQSNPAGCTSWQSRPVRNGVAAFTSIATPTRPHTSVHTYRHKSIHRSIALPFAVSVCFARSSGREAAITANARPGTDGVSGQDEPFVPLQSTGGWVEGRCSGWRMAYIARACSVEVAVTKLYVTWRS